MQPLSQFHWLAQAADHRLFSNQAAIAFLGCLLVQVKHAILDFVPFHAVFWGPLLSPPGSTKTRKPAIQHQQGQF